MEIQPTVLVIDDDESILEVLSQAISAEDLNPLTASNGEDGWKMFESEQPDVIIIDALLPKLNGFELAARIRRTEHGNQIPIIMISGIYKALRMNDQIRDLDINDFLEKPFSIEALIKRTKELLLISNEKSEQTEFFSEKGNLEEVPLPRLLYLLYAHKENGALYLAKGKLKKKIFIRNGEPTFVESNLVQECLGKQMVRKGILTKEQCDESLKLMKEQKKKQGETLIQMGLITPNQLDEALREQARDKLLEIFTWDSGSYHFKSSGGEKTGLTPLDLRLAQILVRGVRDGMTLDFLKKNLDSFLNFKIAIKKNPNLTFEDFRFATWDERIVNEIDGEKTLADILKTKVAREIDIYQLLYALLVTDMIEFVEPQEKKQERTQLNKLKRTLEDMKKQDYFSLLDVSQKANSTELFKSLSKQLNNFHPTTSTLNPNKNPEIENILFEISGLLKTAHETLSNPARRKEYGRDLYFKHGVIPEEPEKLFDKDIEFKKIDTDVQKGAFEKAEPLAKAMAIMFPKEPRFQAVFGWIQFKLLTQKNKQTKSSLQKPMRMIADAVKAAPSEAPGYLYLGHIYKYLEDMETAKNFFKKAANSDPNCIEAERELRLLVMRREKKTNRSFIKWK